MKQHLFFIAFLLGLLMLTACESDPAAENETETEESDTGVHELADDYVLDTSSMVSVTLTGSAVVIDGAGASANGSVVTISSAGLYQVSGSLTNGQIVVNTEDEGTVKLLLNGASITCSNSAPIYVKKAAKVVINLAESTANVLTDGSSYVNVLDGEPNAALFSKADLTIFGSGSLIVNGNYADGISSKDGLIVKSGTISVKSADDAIRGKDYLIVKDGDITVMSTGDGLKSDNTANTLLGYITIESGKINVTSGGDGINGETNVTVNTGEITVTSGGGSSRTVSSALSAKGIKAGVNLTIDGGTLSVSAADDGLHSNATMAINGGTITISSADDGIHAETSVNITDASVSISKSYEGIESGNITVNNSTVRIVASDDGFNATHGTGGEANDNSNLTINSGYVYVNALGGDGLDSNGNIVIAGGTVVVHGPASQPEVGMDYNGTCKVSGGKLIISGTSSNMTQAPSTSSTQYGVLLKFSSGKSAKTLVHIQDSNGNDVLTFAPVRAYQSIVLSSSALTSGSTYTVYTGGSCTGTETDGLYSGGTYSGGTSLTNFTVSNIITTVNK